MLHRLHRIEGQIRGITAMVQRKDACKDLLTQVSAVQGALNKVSRMIEACNGAEHILDLNPEYTPDFSLLSQTLKRVVEGRENVKSP